MRESCLERLRTRKHIRGEESLRVGKEPDRAGWRRLRETERIAMEAFRPRGVRQFGRTRVPGRV